MFLESTYPRNLCLSFFHAYFSTKIYLESLSSGTGFFKAINLWFHCPFYLGTRVLFKASIYHFPTLLSSRRSKDPKLKKFFFQKKVYLESTYPTNRSLNFFHAYFSTKIYLESLSSGTGFFKAIYLWFYCSFWLLKEVRPKIGKKNFQK